MKKIIACCLLVCSLLILITASSPRLLKSIINLLPDRAINGDLYMMSDLKKYKQHKAWFPPAYTEPKLKDINLYLLCDSYADFMDSDYFNLSYCKIIKWDYPPRFISPLNTQKKNILLIECSERVIRTRFKTPANNHLVIKSDYNPLKDRTLKAGLFNIKAEKNIAYILTYSNFICFFKELKAWFNLTVFNRIDDQVSLSKNRQFIFLKETTDSSLLTSSFYPLSNAQVDTLVQNINATYYHFLSLGFTRVYLSLMPNRVSIFDPGQGNYNRLIERIEASPALKIPLIQVYQTFKKSPSTYYFKSDTHWNQNGCNFWLQKVDSVFHSI